VINAIKFEEEFCQKKKDDKKEAGAIIPKTNIKPSMLLPGRQQNITIVLSKLRMNPISIVEAIISYDEKILTPEVCEMIIPILPTESEIHQVDAFDGDPVALADCDQFVLLMTTAPGFDHRFKSMVFKSGYKAEVHEILKRVDNFIKTLDFVVTNKLLHKWLEIILAYGNYLNGTSNRGGAFAFKLDTLTKLGDFKSNDNKKSLMYYLVEYIGDVLKNEELFNVTRDLDVFSQRMQIT
jgi:diaphanous 1